MTFLGHAYTGVVVGVALNRILGLGPLEPLAPAVCAVLGAIPDIPRWYRWFHRASTLSKIVQWVLLPMALHTQAFDKLVHPPVLLNRDQWSPASSFMVEVCTVFGKKLTRHDIHWLTAEAMLVFLNTAILEFLIWGLR